MSIGERTGDGARIEDAEGRTYIDFAGGLGCQNTGHGLPAAVEAIREQLELYLHQCFMVGMYEPYVEVCRLLAELSPCRGAEQRRSRARRPAARSPRLRPRLPRAHAPDDDDDQQGCAVQALVRPV